MMGVDDSFSGTGRGFCLVRFRFQPSENRLQCLGHEVRGVLHRLAMGREQEGVGQAEEHQACVVE